MNKKQKCQAKVDERPCKNSANKKYGSVCGLHKNWNPNTPKTSLTKKSFKPKKAKAGLTKTKIEAIKKKKNEKRQAVINSVAQQTLAAIELAIEEGEDGTGWKMPWRTASSPTNVSTGKSYNGGNWLFLSLTGGEMVASYKQYQKIGLQVRKLEEDDQRYSVLVPKTIYKDELDSNGDPIIDPKTNKPKVSKRVYFDVASVFSIHDTTDMEGYEGTKEKILEQYGNANNEHTPIEKIELMLDKVPATFKTDNKAYYRPSDDTIYLPPQETFNTIEEYYATKAHELIHWSGHSSRLNRETMAENRAANDKKNRAREELVAEMGSSMLAHMWGIEHVTQDNHNKYLAGWKKEIEEDPEVLLWAANEAKKAIDIILDYSNTDEE